MVTLLQGLADGAPFTDPPTVLMQRLHLCDATLTAQSAQTAALVQPVGSFLEAAWPCDAATQHQEATDAADESLLQTVPDSECGGEAHEGVEDGDSSHDVPKDVLIRWGHVLDIVTPVSCLTNCFTKTYTRYAKVCKSTLGSMHHPSS